MGNGVDDRPTHSGRGHDFIRYGSSTEPWRLNGPNGLAASLSASPVLRVDSGETVRDWALAGLGIALLFTIDVADDPAAGRLERVLPRWHGGEAPVGALIQRALSAVEITRLPRCSRRIHG